MTGSDQIEAVFAAALELPEGDRCGYLDRVCGEDAHLRRRVERLLGAHGRGTGFLEAPPTAIAEIEARSARTAPMRAGTRLGAYELVEPIGEGGMGAVWLARRADAQFDKLAAVKLIRRGMDTDRLLKRFALEKRVLALLEHPNVARLLDAGATDDGQPYLVMEYVRGEPIDGWCRARGLDVRERLELFVRVCEAVRHAHGLLVVHRDIKPGNILVGEDGTPKLLDFGIARVLTSEPEGGTLTVGEVGGAAGPLTPRYASPEQIRGEPATTAADVYSLGAVVYELMTGTPAHGATRSTMAEAARTADQLPERPSAAVMAAGGGARLARRLRGDIDTIVLKAMHPEVTRRYPGVGELIDDIRRHLEGRPVRAQRDRLGYRLSRFVGRNRVGVALAATTLGALIGGLAMSLVMYARADTAREDAEQAAYVAQVIAAEAAVRTGDWQSARTRLEAASPSLRGWEWSHLSARMDRRLAQMEGHEGMVLSGAYSPDGRWAVTGGTDGRVLVWNGLDGSRVHEIERHPGEVYAMAWSADGATLATACADTVVRLWRMGADGKGMLDRELLKHGSRATGVVFAGDGRLMSLDMHGELRIWSAAARGTDGGGDGGFAYESIATGVRHAFALAVSPDARWLVLGGPDGAVRVLDLQSRKVVGALEGHRGSINALRFAPDGRTLASSSQDRTARLWNWPGDGTGSMRAVLWGHAARVDGLAFSPDGHEVLSVSWDRTVRAWEVATGRLLRIVGGSPGQMRVAVMHPDGSRLLTGGDAGVSLWDPSGVDVPSINTGMSNHEAVVSADGKVAVGATLEAGGAMAVWDLDTRKRRGTIRVEGRGTTAAAISADGAWWVRGMRDGTVEVYSTADGARARVLNGLRAEGAEPSPVVALGVGPAGEVVAVDARGAVARWRIDGAAPLARSTVEVERLRVVALSPEGGRVLLAGDNEVVVLESRGLTVVGRRVVSDGQVRCVAWSPDGGTIVVGGDDRTIRLLEAAGLSERARLTGHADQVCGLAFSPDGTRLASGSADRSVRLWDVSRREELVALHGHGFSVWKVWFASAGADRRARLISASGDNTLRVWE